MVESTNASAGKSGGTQFQFDHEVLIQPLPACALMRL